MKKVVLAASILALSACSTMQPPRYAVSVDNIQTLKSLTEIKGEFASLNQPAKFSSNCRLMGPIEPADGLSIPQFITKAFNDELKMADKYSKDNVKITGDITKIEFSSISGLTSGYWEIGLKLKSTNGTNLTVNNKYSFKSGFDAITACNATADALSPAVQDLIKATVNHPEFSKLMQES
ncbi:hypothetical protein HUZ36_18710 [Pseudoalteromonas sp. McH1-7]|uniref:Lipoprotein n=1 Tax=Pseudoalteromonas peptidolytica F12-50-A1 TaxID=1315280 RepID=A0A8I0MUP4_9GAMM|nr:MULTISPECIES: hypothetical protein [Pseudoalteromonas]MBE0345748.1 hypothetical protein [Pseudoalteromonas peptidolytica F12-50-A1]NLR14364.1 hypothetical protein [Pseudoalteromonas peptidolytica]NUZ12814.1 hypothetical protein [Pseudoalteromonas sp. McH1-7]RXF02241.1 hypothetical protein D9603_11455 [Pseudoalteromonas sp. PS5]USD27555.1 hypothetical protein J8Z24_11355 [Pseudoalteromonas sp. SCSIO 43201]